MKRVSPSMAVALLALFVALGGTGYAAAKINGRTIQNRSIPGTKLQRNTLGGAQIRESSLGKVPNASDTDFLDGRPASAYLLAGTGIAANSLRLGGKDASAFLPVGGTAANAALLAGNPASAFLPAGGTAANAALLGGRPAADFVPAGKVQGAGPVTLTVPAVAAPNEAELVSDGSLRVVAQCLNDGTARVVLRHSAAVLGPVATSGGSLAVIPGPGDEILVSATAGQLKRDGFAALSAPGAAAAGLQGAATAISDGGAQRCYAAAWGVAT